MSTARIWRAATQALRDLAHGIFGFDFFVSYAWSDARPSARAIAGELSAARFEVFLDDQSMGGGEVLDQSIARALSRSSVMVLLVSRGAVQSRFVEEEVRLFAATGRPIIPIDVDRSLERLPSSHPLAVALRNRIRVDAPSGDLLGETLGRVVAELRNAFGFVRRARIRTLALLGIALILLALTTAAVLGFLEQREQRIVARSRELAAQAQLAQAEAPFEAAELALQAMALRPSVAARQVLLTNLAGLPAHLWEHAEPAAWREGRPVRGLVAFAAGGEHVVARASDARLVRRAIGTGARLDTVERPELEAVRLDGNVEWPLAASADGRHIAVLAAGERIQVLDVAAGGPLRTVHVPGAGQRRWAIGEDGAVLAGIDRDGALELWDSETGERTAALELLPGDAFAADGLALDAARRRVAVSHLSAARSAGEPPGRSVSVIAWETGEVVRAIHNLPAHVWSLSFAPAPAQRLAVATSLGAVVLRLDGPYPPVQTKTRRALRAIRFAPGGVLLGASTEQGDGVSVISAGTGETLARTDRYTYLESFAFSPDGMFLATSGLVDREPAPVLRVDLWDLSRASALRPALRAAGKPVAVVALDHAGRRIAAAHEHGVEVRDLRSGRLLRSLSVPAEHREDFEYPQTIAFDARDERVVATSAARTEAVWDAASGALVELRSAPSRPAAGLASADGEVLVGRRHATQEPPAALVAWRRSDGAVLGEIPAPARGRLMHSLSRDGRYLAWASAVPPAPPGAWEAAVVDLGRNRVVARADLGEPATGRAVQALDFDPGRFRLVVAQTLASDEAGPETARATVFAPRWWRALWCGGDGAGALSLEPVAAFALSPAVTEIHLVPRSDTLAVLDDASAAILDAGDGALRVRLPIPGEGFRDVGLARHLLLGGDGASVLYTSGTEPWVQRWRWRDADLSGETCARLPGLAACRAGAAR